MAPPFPFPPGTPVIKVEDDRDQELRDMFAKNVQRHLELTGRRKSLQPSGFAQPQHPPAPPVQQAPLPPPPPPPPPPRAQHPCAKRLPIGPPPGFGGARTPPLKQYQRRPPGPPAQAPQQPAPPNSHRAPAAAPPALNAQRAGHVPQPAAGGAQHGATATAAAAPLAHAGPIPIAAVVPALQRRTMAPKPKHPAARKKPTVPCDFCGVLCMTAWHLKQHEKGRKHRNRVAYLAGEMNVQCSVCNVHLSSGLNVQQLYAGKQHLLRLKLNTGA